MALTDVWTGTRLPARAAARPAKWFFMETDVHTDAP